MQDYAINGTGTIKTEKIDGVIFKMSPSAGFMHSQINRNIYHLNTHEIFGMAILEAMYYDNTVIVLKASGSALITENNVSVYICNSEEEVVQKVMTVKTR